MTRDKVYIDEERCTACGLCIPVCPSGAIRVAEGKARVDDNACDGCRACLDACPEQAIQQLVQGELVRVVEPAPPTMPAPQPLRHAVAAGLLATGLGLLSEVGSTLIRAMGRYVDSRIGQGQMPGPGWRAPAASDAAPLSTRQSGRQMRHRHRRG